MDEEGNYNDLTARMRALKMTLYNPNKSQTNEQPSSSAAEEDETLEQRVERLRQKLQASGTVRVDNLPPSQIASFDRSNRGRDRNQGHRGRDEADDQGVVNFNSNQGSFQNNITIDDGNQDDLGKSADIDKNNASCNASSDLDRRGNLNLFQHRPIDEYRMRHQIHKKIARIEYIDDNGARAMPPLDDSQKNRFEGVHDTGKNIIGDNKSGSSINRGRQESDRKIKRVEAIPTQPGNTSECMNSTDSHNAQNILGDSIKLKSIQYKKGDGHRRRLEILNKIEGVTYVDDNGARAMPPIDDLPRNRFKSAVNNDCMEASLHDYEDGTSDMFKDSSGNATGGLGGSYSNRRRLEIANKIEGVEYADDDGARSTRDNSQYRGFQKLEQKYRNNYSGENHRGRGGNRGNRQRHMDGNRDGGRSRSRQTRGQYAGPNRGNMRGRGDSAQRAEDEDKSCEKPPETPKFFNDECPICVEDFSPENGGFMVLDCRHRYHNHCALHWAASQKQSALTCAICSKEIPKIA